MRIPETLKKLLPRAFARGAAEPQPPSPSTKPVLSPEEKVTALVAASGTGARENLPANIRTMFIADRTLEFMEYFFRRHSETLKYIGPNPNYAKAQGPKKTHYRHFTLMEGASQNLVYIDIRENGEGGVTICSHGENTKTSSFSVAAELPIDKAVANIFDAFVKIAPESVRKCLMAGLVDTAERDRSIVSTAMSKMYDLFKRHPETFETDIIKRSIKVLPGAHRTGFNLQCGSVSSHVSLYLHESGEANVSVWTGTEAKQVVGEKSPFNVSGRSIDEAAESFFAAFVKAAPLAVAACVLGDFKGQGSDVPQNGLGRGLQLTK